MLNLVFSHPYWSAVLLPLIVGSLAGLSRREVAVFYWWYLKRFLKEWRETWKKELSTTVILALIIFALQSRRHEADAAKGLLDLLEGACIMLIGWAAFHALRVPWLLHREGPEKPAEPPSNLQVNWDGLIMGPLFLSDDGVWSSSVTSSSSDAARYRYIGIRIRVSNPHISAKKVGPAVGVTGLVEFTYETGVPGWRGSPAAWVHEPFPKIIIDVDHDKELILAVGGNKEWSVISNVRRSDGAPVDRAAMQFRDAPWNSGTVKVSIIHNGEATSKEYEWNDAYSGLPTIRPIVVMARSAL